MVGCVKFGTILASSTVLVDPMSNGPDLEHTHLEAQSVLLRSFLEVIDELDVNLILLHFCAGF